MEKLKEGKDRALLERLYQHVHAKSEMVSNKAEQRFVATGIVGQVNYI